ncbi:phosphoribosylglycinamide formyltransferase [Nitrosomonas aestuarii]|uniref:phosphoribosylglycinamide formyltransferase n=1 Tax=Nitrosomonas aestuarii TaxID=52441 RepID=UPI000D31017C|nr:phosphoribosylglycinamide formyltransferase [Nitrosomonas aestuarii]PTN12203.1 formyltetrahydrofolate-dependent phosphoribosylglycinamide formyltransferase [Nitrosomonas aestuarii]
MKTLVILISGRGSNMQALLEAQLPVDRIVVVSNNPDAEGLKTAAALGIQTATIDHRVFSNREAFDTALAEEIDHYQPELIALAGFMRILTRDFVLRYQGRLMNIHPSLLPAFPGLHTHQRALQEGVKIHGCTVHFVTSALDHGPIVIQAAIPILANDTCQTLAKRVLQQEHRIYSQAVCWFMHGRIKLCGNTVTVSETGIHDFVIFSPGLQE